MFESHCTDQAGADTDYIDYRDERCLVVSRDPVVPSVYTVRWPENWPGPQEREFRILFPFGTSGETLCLDGDVCTIYKRIGDAFFIRRPNGECWRVVVIPLPVDAVFDVPPSVTAGADRMLAS